MVTSIHRRLLKNKIQLETWKQDEGCQKIQNPRERKCFVEEIVDAPFESIINTGVEV